MLNAGSSFLFSGCAGDIVYPALRAKKETRHKDIQNVPCAALRLVYGKAKRQGKTKGTSDSIPAHVWPAYFPSRFVKKVRHTQSMPHFFAFAGEKICSPSRTRGLNQRFLSFAKKFFFRFLFSFKKKGTAPRHQTNSIMAVSAASPRRTPVRVMRV